MNSFSAFDSCLIMVQLSDHQNFKGTIFSPGNSQGSQNFFSLNDAVHVIKHFANVDTFTTCSFPFYWSLPSDSIHCTYLIHILSLEPDYEGEVYCYCSNRNYAFNTLAELQTILLHNHTDISIDPSYINLTCNEMISCFSGYNTLSYAATHPHIDTSSLTSDDWRKISQNRLKKGIHNDKSKKV